MWWTAASAAIDVSEVATLDNQLADERLGHYGPSAQNISGVEPDVPVLPTHFGNQNGDCPQPNPNE